MRRDHVEILHRDMLQIAAPTYELVNGTYINAPYHLCDYSSEENKERNWCQ